MDQHEQSIFKNRVDESDVEGHRSMAKADGPEGIRAQRDGGEAIRTSRDGTEGVRSRTQRLDDEGDVEGHRVPPGREGEDIRTQRDGGDGIIPRTQRLRPEDDRDDDVEGHLFRNGPTTQGESRPAE